MKVSIIIPIYNTNPIYVEECISSCINKGYEIIVINDGSSIDYSNILNQYSTIKYIKTPNRGLSAARNLGMLMSKGEYIFFLDSDDMIIEDGINTMIKNSNNNDIVLSKIHINRVGNINKNYCFYDGSFKIKDKRELIESILLLNQKFTSVDTVWAKLYKRDFIEKNNIKFNPKLRNSEDVMFNYECYTKANNIYFCDDISYLYRVNSSSVCQSYVKDLDKRFNIFINEFYNYLKNNNIEESLFNDHVFRVVRRVFRKYYYYLDNYEDFCNKINNILNDEIIMECLKQINIEYLNEDQKQLIKNLNNKNLNNLYSISRNAKILDLK